MANVRSQQQNTRCEVGQSLVEMVIAVAIILTGLVGVLSLTVSNLTGATENEARIVASNLVREGIEVVRNIRDTNWLKGQVWDAGLKSGTDYTAIAVFNPTANTWELNFAPNSIDDPQTQFKKQDDGTYLQGTESGTPTAYRRLITLDEICKDLVNKLETIKSSGEACGMNEEKVGIRVRSEVKWYVSGRTRQMVGEDRIYNWR